MMTLIMDDRALQLFAADMRGMAADIAGTNRMRRPLLEIAKEVLIPSINKNFAAGGRPKRWEPALPISQYRTQHGGGPTLWVTGKMKKAATRMARFKVKNNVMTYGNFPPTVWFAMVHDQADIARRANVPHRPFALIQKEDIPKIERIMMRWYEKMVNRHIRLKYP